MLVPVTLPTPWSILRLMAPFTDQESVLICPDDVADGLAEKLVIDGRLPVTITVAVAVVLPPEFVAVSR